MSRDYQAFAYEALTSTSAAVGPTPATRDNARAALVTVEGADARFRCDGGAPTTSVGHLIKDGGSVRVSGADSVRNMRFIAVSGTLSVRVTYER